MTSKSLPIKRGSAGRSSDHRFSSSYRRALRGQSGARRAGRCRHIPAQKVEQIRHSPGNLFTLSIKADICESSNVCHSGQTRRDSAIMSTMIVKRAYFSSELGAIVRAERKALRLSQADLAERVHVSRQTIVDLEKGGNVSLQVLNAVMAGLGKVLTVTDARPSLEEASHMFDDDDDQDQAAESSHPSRPRG